MRLLNVKSMNLENFVSRIPPYVILSHCWAKDEITFEDVCLPEGTAHEPLDSLPPPRVAIVNAEPDAQVTRKDPLVTDREYHTAKLTCNRRLTAKDWYQDVRHFEFELDENVQ